jgi:hypothetical protein
VREEDALTPLATILGLLTQSPKQAANCTAKECKHHEPKTELEWLSEFSNTLALMAAWTFHAHLRAELWPNDRGQARREQGIRNGKRAQSRRGLHHACSAMNVIEIMRLLSLVTP